MLQYSTRVQRFTVMACRLAVSVTRAASCRPLPRRLFFLPALLRRTTTQNTGRSARGGRRAKRLPSTWGDACWPPTGALGEYLYKVSGFATSMGRQMTCRTLFASKTKGRQKWAKRRLHPSTMSFISRIRRQSRHSTRADIDRFLLRPPAKPLWRVASIAIASRSQSDGVFELPRNRSGRLSGDFNSQQETPGGRAPE